MTDIIVVHRGNDAGTVGRHYRDNTANVCQRLRFFYDNRLCQVQQSRSQCQVVQSRLHCQVVQARLQC